jgi:hypothetical protein
MNDTVIERLPDIATPHAELPELPPAVPVNAAPQIL